MPPVNIPQELAYVHFTTNNTIYGTQWLSLPNCNVPLIADMSSDIFGRKRDYERCAMFYAVAQKNIGPAGVTLAVIRKDMLLNGRISLPPMLSYFAHDARGSVLNTPPVFAIYTSLLMLRWTEKKTLDAIERENVLKADMLYREIERNSLFTPTVEIGSRSIMNVCFLPVNPALGKQFLDFCEEHNITGIEGHRTVGGFRVSLYNAIPLRAVEYLVDVMKAFELKYAN